MGFEALLAALERDAEAQAEALLAAAREDAARLRAVAESGVARRLAERRHQVAQEHERETSGEVARARHAARARELEAQGALLDAVRRRAAERLATLETAAWADAIPGMIATALRYAGEDPVVLRCAGAAAHAVRAAIPEQAKVRVVPDAAVPPGLVASAAGESVTIPLTLTHRLDALWPDLRLEVLRALEVAS